MGNKLDLEDNRIVTSKEGACFALENNFFFMEISSLDNQNVSEAFEYIIEITNLELKKKNYYLQKSEAKIQKKYNYYHFDKEITGN